MATVLQPSFPSFPAGYGLWPCPPFYDWVASTQTLDANGEYTGLVFRPPKTGNIDGMGAAIIAVNQAPASGLRFSLQDPSATTGLPDGTPDQTVTIAQGSVVTGWMEVTFSSTRAVTRGVGTVCAVIDFPSFAAGDHVQFRALTSIDQVFGCPYGLSNGTKNQQIFLSMALHYDDGIWVNVPNTFVTLSTVGTFTYDLGTTPDEVAMGFTVPYPMSVAGVKMANAYAAGTNHEVLLYDGGSVVVAQAVGFDGDQVAGAGGKRIQDYIFEADYLCIPGVTYRVSCRPTTTTGDVQTSYLTAPTATIYANIYGTTFASTRSNLGVWTDYNNGSDGYRTVPWSLYVNGGEFGAMLVHPGMSGGMRG